MELLRNSLREWRESHPGKTDRDWLIEVRCKSEEQREDLKRLFKSADENHIKIEVCPIVGLFENPQKVYRQAVQIDPEWLDEDDIAELKSGFHTMKYVEADFEVIGRYNRYYDLDAPDDVFENPIPDLYLNWKMKQLDIDPLFAHTDSNIYSVVKPYMGASIPHWKNIITDWKFA